LLSGSISDHPFQPFVYALILRKAEIARAIEHDGQSAQIGVRERPRRIAQMPVHPTAGGAFA
jgi:hypothetical protein